MIDAKENKAVKPKSTKAVCSKCGQLEHKEGVPHCDGKRLRRTSNFNLDGKCKRFK